ncbi:Panacea domain-containing protein [Mycobacterium sp. URHD0025]|uniref:Panacea domain-containing protein n=1 Tax=Mycobacterium sp. URHD0025 TaxID=1298864 RepID=UPI00048B59AE|nr:Panacea domain-containing protein [Mycobacterium sp. URHD0025]
MATAIDVGQYVYQRKGWVNAWCLQKLVYFAHAWSLAWDGQGLFDSELEAWPDGPVERELYAVNKYYRDGGYFSTDLFGADVSRLTPRQMAVIDAVIAHYGDWSKDELVEASHTPVWQAARGDAGRHAQGGVLATRDIRRWHTRAALTGADAPEPPSDYVGGLSDVSNELVDAQIARWRGALDLLAER